MTNKTKVRNKILAKTALVIASISLVVFVIGVIIKHNQTTEIEIDAKEVSEIEITESIKNKLEPIPLLPEDSSLKTALIDAVEETTNKENETTSKIEESAIYVVQEYYDNSFYCSNSYTHYPTDDEIDSIINEWDIAGYEYIGNETVDYYINLFFKSKNVNTQDTVVENNNENNQNNDNIDISQINDVYELAYALYGISELDVSRMLKLCTYEGYGADPTLDMYCCMCMVNRVIEDYWGYGNIYNAFGEIDWQYGTWMDSLGIADHAYSALWNALMYLDRNVRYCNGLQNLDYAIYVSDVYWGFGVWY